MKTRKKQLGFTLIEILVAATIMAVLTAIGLVSFSIANRNARDAKRKADLEQVRAALEIYRSDNTSYPAVSVTGNLAQVGTIATYLTSTSVMDPKDPTTQYTYVSATGATYQVCATLEVTQAAYCLNSP